MKTGRHCSAKYLIAAVSQAVNLLIGIVEASLRLDDSIPLKANTIKVGKEWDRLPVASRKDLVQSWPTTAQILSVTAPEIIFPEHCRIWDVQFSGEFAQKSLGRAYVSKRLHYNRHRAHMAPGYFSYAWASQAFTT
jgi:hypothetical protein